MKARIGFNKNGAAHAWRCYGTFESTNEETACIAPDGSLTSQDCKDPRHATGKYCTRTAEIEALIDNLLTNGCPTGRSGKINRLNSRMNFNEYHLTTKTSRSCERGCQCISGFVRDDSGMFKIGNQKRKIL